MQNVGTPVFYVCILQWLKSLGKMLYTGKSFDGTNEHQIIGINPAATETITGGFGSNDTIRYNTYEPLGNLMVEDNNFMMVLGHNLNAVGVSIFLSEGEETPPGSSSWDVVANIDYLNGSYNIPTYNGFSISRGTDSQDIQTKLIQFRFDGAGGDKSIAIGSLLYGNYYQMPHSPDLSLTMTREMDGFKRIRTRGGNDLTDYNYKKAPSWWSNLAPWELTDNRPALTRAGRRVWDLSFSYLDDGDVFGSNQTLQTHSESLPDGLEAGDYSTHFNYNLLTDNNFFSQVIHKTNGGQLPFVFQPNGNNKNPDQFAICKLDKGFKFNQVANGVYNISLKIREVW